MVNYTLHIDFSQTFKDAFLKDSKQDGGLQCHKDQLSEKEAFIYDEQTALEFSWVGGRRLSDSRPLGTEVFLLAF